MRASIAEVDSGPAAPQGPRHVRRPSVAGSQAVSSLRSLSTSSGDRGILTRLQRAEESQRLFEEALGSYRRLLSEVNRRRTLLAEISVALDTRARVLELQEASLREREEAAERAAASLEQLPRMSIAGGHAIQVTDVSGGATSFDPTVLAPGSPPSFGGAPGVSDPGGLSDIASAHPVGPGDVPSAGATSPVPPNLDLTPTSLVVAARRHAERLPSGIPRLDSLLLGGLPPRSHVVLVGDAFIGKEVTLYAFIAEGLRRDEPVILVTSARGTHDVSKGLRLVLPDLEQYQANGRVTWVDASGTGRAAPPHWLAPKDAEDTSGLLTALTDAAKWAREASSTGRFRVGFLGLSAALAHRTEREAFVFLQSVFAILRPCEAMAMYALEAGAISEPQVETLLGRMDGAVVFRQNREQTLLSVKGFGEVATRDWIACRVTDRELVLGSFALERIR